MPCAVVAPALLVCTARFFFRRQCMRCSERTYACTHAYLAVCSSATYARTDRGDATARTVP